LKNIIIEKENQVNKIATTFDNSKSFIIFEYQGLNAKTLTDLRTKLYDTGSKMLVLKNNIINRSLVKCNITDFGTELSGPNSILFGLEDELAIFKNIGELKKEFDFINIKGGYLNNEFVDESKIQALALIPNREGLYSMLLSCLTSPIRGVMYALKAVADAK